MAMLADPLRLVVGSRLASQLEDALGVRTMEDLLGYYPRRYYQRGELTDLASLRDGDYVTVQARVENVSVRRMHRRTGTILEAIVTDGHGRLRLTFFARGAQQWREATLRPGMRGLFSGQVSTYHGVRQLAHPEFEALDPGEAIGTRAEEFANALIPVYPANSKISSPRIARVVETSIGSLDVPDDPIPADVRRQHKLCGLADALRGIHRPIDDTDLRRAQKRLKWDEAFSLQVLLAQRRRAAADYVAAPRPRVSGGLADAFDAALAFELTIGQQLAGATIADELACDHPMHRLLQGEVGSGKTVVAVRAMLQVVDAAGQAVLLAPTEVLAQQHYRSITAMLGPLGMGGQLGGAAHATRVALVTGSQGAASRRRALLDAASGEAGIVVGTHALLEERVQFAELGLVVIDEQHRFGVEQRDALTGRAGDGRPHMLVMTATPIPRTVAMTVFGDLDVCTLTELPAGRQTIATHIVPAGERPQFLSRAWERIREEVAAGRQAYVVCPRIGGDSTEDASERASAWSGGNSGPDALFGAGPGDGDSGPQRPPQAVMDLAPALADGPLRGLRLAVLHGRLPPDEKDAAMLAFADGSVDVLVSTTVVEVGVDVPNASVMVIMDAERFGVSQLHQLRGRVGRGQHEGLCLLVTEWPAASAARRRLDAVAATLDGFRLSRIDLEERGEGDVLGAVQAGHSRSGLKLVTLLRDEQLVVAARDEAQRLVDANPVLTGLPALSARVARLLSDERSEFLEKA